MELNLHLAHKLVNVSHQLAVDFSENNVSLQRAHPASMNQFIKFRAEMRSLQRN